MSLGILAGVALMPTFLVNEKIFGSSVVIFQSLIQIAGRFAIRKAIMGDFIETALLEIIADFAAVDAVFRGLDSEDLAEKFERALLVAFEIRENLAHIEVTLGAEPACIEQEVPRNRNSHDGAPDIDIRKIEGLAVERDKPLRPDLPNVGPEIGEQLALVRLAIGTGTVQFQPVNADANNPAGAGIEAEAIENLLAVFVGLDVEENLSSSGWNCLGVLPDSFNVDD